MREADIYRAALEKWGADAQTLMVFEEMAELEKELCKNARGKTTAGVLRRRSQTFKLCWSK
nr:hypothetical protein [uncultured Oscillibacter sp.]